MSNEGFIPSFSGAHQFPHRARSGMRQNELFNGQITGKMSILSVTMPRITPVLFPAASRQLEALGERVRLARLRRQYSTTMVASRAGITRSTLYRVEAGDPGVSIGTYAGVLRVLGLQGDFDAVAKDDALGRKLQDMELPVRRVAPRKKRAVSAEGSAGVNTDDPTKAEQ